jgi:hypothetical protein
MGFGGEWRDRFVKKRLSGEGGLIAVSIVSIAYSVARLILSAVFLLWTRQWRRCLRPSELGVAREEPGNGRHCARVTALNKQPSRARVEWLQWIKHRGKWQSFGPGRF